MVNMHLNKRYGQYYLMSSVRVGNKTHKIYHGNFEKMYEETKIMWKILNRLKKQIENGK